MDPLDLEFDRYQRFRAAADLVEEVAGSRRLEILEVGGFDDRFRWFVPRHDLSSYDGLISRAEGGLGLPDSSCQVVVALDVLEHVAPGDRPFFLAELARVCSEAFIISFPVPGAALAEDFVLRVTGSGWLAEHKKYGLPDPHQVDGWLGDLGVTFRSQPNASLASWTAMMLLMYGLDDAGLRRDISGFFNRNFYRLENRSPAYRLIYLCRPGA